MSQAPDELLTCNTLFESQHISVNDYNCRACRGGPGEDEYANRHQIVLLRRGVFRKHVGRDYVVADVNQAIFFAKESIYRVSHPVDDGNRGTVFTLGTELLADMLGEFDPAYAEEPDRSFPFMNGPCSPSVFWKHRELIQRLESADARPLDPLWVTETVLAMMANIVVAAFDRHDTPRKGRRPGTAADHAERTEAAKSYLASHLGERLTLDDVARSVHTSPYHLARLFRHHTGVPVHRYLTQLRLRASLERLADGEADLTGLALDLGYSSHSHFTDAFRDEFGCTPSVARKDFDARAFVKTSKVSEV